MVRINMNNIKQKQGTMTQQDQAVVDYYNTYLDSCKLHGITPEVDIATFSKVHRRARIWLSTYLDKVPGQEENACIILPVDSNMLYIAQVKGGLVHFGFITKEMYQYLDIGGGKSDVSEN